ncbi:hypothetical protein DXD59_00550 [Olsenella sp. TM06-36]|uniref:hypothetical protein n=1 Tax=Olsenella sp. TM06-36 TaxID=2292361 RepID=UPI000E4499B3|nr:hypothetical protein [Olsenella sp. TM06-36]RGJ47420.1 hypothetical protein DXD59_00550 [Olsenella sp. TM06-36]
MAVTPRATETYGDVTGFTNEFIETEIANGRNSALNAQIFCTVDNTLQANAGDIVSIGRIAATGAAEDVAEGKGNTGKISVGVSEVDYEVKTVQAWFQYTDERLRRTPTEVAAGISHLGVALYNKFNDEFYAELAKTTNTLSATAFDFDAIVDAQSQISLDTYTTDGMDEGAVSDVQGAVGAQTNVLIGKDLLKALRKSAKDELKYVEGFIRAGYVGTIGGTNLYYTKIMDGTAYKNTAFMFTKGAVTDFVKAAVEIEASQKGTRSSDDANKRINNIFARQSYIVALTDTTKAVKVTVGTGTAGN